MALKSCSNIKHDQTRTSDWNIKGEQKNELNLKFFERQTGADKVKNTLSVGDKRSIFFIFNLKL